MATDLDIARQATLAPIEDIATKAGFDKDTIIPYGRGVAKVDPSSYLTKEATAKLILVGAINPTPAGEGKTTVSVALADGMRVNGQKAMLALREPSLGPVFGMKGGATGGGYAQVVPMESINLHFTGDLHAITAANNLLSALIDNHITQGNVLQIDPRKICFRQCLDVNNRQLRNILTGVGDARNGIVREDGFDITAASEVMATFCLASDLQDLKARLSRIVVGYNYQGEAVTCGQIGGAGAMTALLRDAFMPNLVQTLEHTPCLMHGGPFANIAHGCNSAVATKTALRMADYVVTEAGFGADLGAEKFLDIKCRMNGLWPSVIVLVATIRALKHHGGVAKADLGSENLPALETGMQNLLAHVSNVQNVWKTPVVVALNRFITDTQAEMDLLTNTLQSMGVSVGLCDGWANGGKGTADLAKIVCDTADQNPSPLPSFTYASDLPLMDKVRAVAQKIYHAKDVTFTADAIKAFDTLEKSGYSDCPVCIAKTQYSMSDDAKKLGAPEGYTLTIRNARLSAGAGFVVAFAGNIIAMPGLSKAPAALSIDVDEQGEIVGLF